MLLMGEYDRANEYLIYALDLFNKKNQRFGAMETRIKMGYVALEKLDYTQAKGLFQEGLHSAQMIGTRRRLVGSIRGFAGVSLGIGDLARSARLFGAAEAMVKISGSRYSQPDEEAIDGRNLASLRALLEEEKFAVAWREGMQMDLEEAIAYALEEW
jgi:tetratricopeptide (TPR) repeat protein